MLMDDGNWQEVTSVLEDRNKIEDRRQSEQSFYRILSRGRRKVGESRTLLAECTGTLTKWWPSSWLPGTEAGDSDTDHLMAVLKFCRYLITLLIPPPTSSFTALEMTHDPSSGQNHRHVGINWHLFETKSKQSKQRLLDLPSRQL